MSTPKEIANIGEHTLIETRTIRSNTGSVSFNVPVHTDLLIRFSNLSSIAQGLIEVRPNSIEHSGSFSTIRSTAGNTPLSFIDQDSTASNAAGLVSCGDETDFFDGEINIRAHSGSYRTFDSSFFVRSGSSLDMSFSNFRSVWRDDTTVMSSVQIHHNAGSNMASGLFEIYKYNNFPFVETLDFELPVVSGLVARWRPDSDNITLNGLNVSASIDIALSHDMEQTNPALQATYNSSSLNMNGHPTISYASPETIVTPDAADLDMGQNSFLVLQVMKRPHYVPSYSVLWGKGDKPGADNLRGFITFNHKLQLFWGNDVQAYAESTIVIPNDIPCMLGWGIDASTDEVIYVVNGTVERIGVTLSGTGANSLPFRIHGDGDAANYDDDAPEIAETIVYKRAVTAWTDAEIQGVYNNYAQPYYDL